MKKDSVYGPDRPGRIDGHTVWNVECKLCKWTKKDFVTYQEASIALSQHLEQFHPGWEEEVK